MVLKRPPMCVIYTSHYDNNNNENTLNIHKTEKNTTKGIIVKGYSYKKQQKYPHQQQNKEKIKKSRKFTFYS